MTYRATLERTSTGHWVAESVGPRGEIRVRGESLDAAVENLRREIRLQLANGESELEHPFELEVHCLPPVHADGWSGV